MRIKIFSVFAIICIVCAEKIGAQSLTPAVKRPGVTMIVFASFDCPYSAKFSLTLERLKKRFPTQLAIKLKNLPVSQSEDSIRPHLAVLAANEQGKFVEYYNALNAANPMPYTEGELVLLAESLNLNVPRFKKSMRSKKIQREIDADFQDAQALNVKTTPITFINGIRIENFQLEQPFLSIIDNIIRE